MPSLLDREIESTRDDAFGHRHYAKALESLIETSDHTPPFSIGLLGKWGTGKSSIKMLYLQSLGDDQTKTQGCTRAERIRPVTFNAWRFGGEDIKRALLKHVFCELGGEKDKITDALYARIRKTVEVPKAWREILWETYDRWPWLLVQILAVAFMLGASWYALQLLHIGNDWVKGAVAAIFAYVFNPTRFIVSRYTNFLRVSEPTTAAEQYEDLLVSQLIQFKNHGGKRCERLVVFIDDLDRLSADEMVSGLDAIRTFMEMPKIPAGLGIVFVISCDEERIATALGRRNRDAETPATVVTRDDARRFLDRIFQFRLEIPPFPRRDIEAYAKSKLLSGAPEILRDLESGGHDVDNVIGRMIHQGVRSPRNALQILNAFLQCWWVARKREQDGAGSDRTGGLAEGAVTNHPASLAAVCALRVDFPDFYSDLEEEPDLIARFTAVFVLGKDIKQQPEAIRNVLHRYHDDDGALRHSYYELRQYISSLRGLIWPASIQPLILLSQDPVMRRFGDNARRVYDAFVSGDVQGVLAAFGRDIDANALGPAETSLLEGLERDLYRESDLKQNSAYSVVVALSTRLPETTARQLLTHVSRRLIQSTELRQLVGITGIETSMRYSAQEERRLIAGQLIEDLLRTQNEIEFRLPSGELPSLDEAVDIVRDACKLVLAVRDEDSLESSSDQRFIAWLMARRVGIGGREQLLGLNELDGWVGQYESSLLSALRENYSELILDELAKDTDSDIDVAVALGRCRKVFELLWEAGEDSRKILYQQLSRCIALKCESAVTLACEVMQSHIDSPDASAITEYFVNFADRLQKENEQETVWELDAWENHYSVLLRQVTERKQSIVGKTAGPVFAKLAISWGGDDQTAQYALQLVDLLIALHRPSAAEVISSWTKTMFSDLDMRCVGWLAASYLSMLSKDENAAVIASVSQVTENAALSEEEGKRYQEIIKSVPMKAIQSAEFQVYLRQLLPFVQNQYNSSDYLQRVFPALPRIVAACPQTELGNMLYGLFANTQSSIEVFGWLHSQMTGYWPKQSPETGSYNPETIFSGASTVLSQYPQHAMAPSILDSIVDLIKRGIVGVDQATTAVLASCLIWPTYQEASLKAFETLAFAPTLSDIVNLGNGIDLSNDGQVASLAKAWQLISPLLTIEQRSECTQLILAETTKGNAQEPDLCLRLWLHSSSEHESIVRTLIVDQTLNDDQRKRLWLQAVRVANQLGQVFFLEMLPSILQMADSEETDRSVLDHEQQVSALFAGSTDDRYKLGQILLRSFIVTPTQTAKNALAAWLHRLRVSGVLKELKDLGDVTESDIETLKSVFGNVGYLRKLDRRRAE